MYSFIDTFVRLVLELKLEDSHPQSRMPFSRKNTRTEYKFVTKDAIRVLWNMNSKKYQDGNALTLIVEFVSSRLLHCPANRILEVPTPSTVLQPTAKGWAHVSRWCELHPTDVSAVKSALTSTYNTMELVELERSLSSGRLLLSSGMAMVLWQRILGSEPNIYRFQQSGISANLTASNTPAIAPSSRDAASPYFHRYFTHPSTNSISQYFDSRGVRVFSDLRFTSGVTVDWVISGKALWQWTLECTTVSIPAEASKVTRLLLEQGFLYEIEDTAAEAIACADTMPHDLSRNTMYTFTGRGRKLCPWYNNCNGPSLASQALLRSADLDKSISRHSSTSRLSKGKSPRLEYQDCAVSDVDEPWWWEAELPAGLRVDSVFPQVVTLDMLLHEPGLKMLFRRQLQEWRCAEILLFFDEAKRITLLHGALKLAETFKDKFRAAAIANQAVPTLAALRKIFLVPDAPLQLNMPQRLNRDLLESLEFLDGVASKDSQTKMSRRHALSLLSQVELPLEAALEHMISLLRNQVSRFASSDKLRSIPIRQYILANSEKFGLKTITSNCNSSNEDFSDGIAFSFDSNFDFLPFDTQVPVADT